MRETVWLTLFIKYFLILGGVCFLGFFNLSTPSLAKTDFYGTKTRKLHFWHFKVPKSKILSTLQILFSEEPLQEGTFNFWALEVSEFGLPYIILSGSHSQGTLQDGSQASLQGMQMLLQIQVFPKTSHLVSSQQDSLRLKP